jgi:hypothetical protein
MGRMRVRTRLRGIAEGAATHVVRGAERVLPPRVLALLAWPGAALAALAGLLVQPAYVRALRRLPWPVSFPALWRDRTRLEMARLIAFWRDRLGSPRWRERCRIDGAERLVRGRPAILAVLHFGPINLLPSLFRARGHAATGLVTDRGIESRPPARAPLDRLEDEAYGLGHVPRLLSVGDLWDTREQLEAGGVLLFAADGRKGRKIQVRSGEVTAFLGRGLLRLAHITHAEVHPCLVCAGPGLSCTVSVGAPLPREMVEDRARHGEAYAQLLAALLDGVRRAPGQCRHVFLRALEPPGSRKGRPRSPEPPPIA